MSTCVSNHVPGMSQHKGQTINRFGLDQTGTINYQFNQQGFRAPVNFNFVPDYAFFGCSLVFGVGVQYDCAFPTMFAQSHNYGLAGEYNNDDIFLIIENYLNSNVYNSLTKKFVCWADRNTENIDNYSNQLSQQGFIQLFCGDTMPYKNCFAMLSNIDVDASHTHMGTNTHLTIYKLLCSLFNR
jgi:hypothetical protein